MISEAAILESTELSARAQNLARGSQKDRQEAQILLQRIENIQRVGLSSDEIRTKYSHGQADRKQAEYRAKFDQYLAGDLEDREFRDFLAGTQSLSWTAGVQGGFTVPFAYDDTLRAALAQIDPVLDSDVTDFTMKDGPFGPSVVSGFDLSTINAQLIGEAAQQNPQAIPLVAGKTLNSNLIFKASFAASMEGEQDIENFAEKIVTASGWALARRIGQSVMTGKGGSTDIQGLTNELGAPTISNGTPGKIVLGDINNIYFAVNRAYRAAKKCGWLMNDAAYKLVRNATDSQGRPLLDMQDDKEELLGKNVYVSPSLSIASAGVGLLLFGDLSHVVIRATKPQLQRAIQLGQADVTKGEALYIARMRCDATLFDPSQGNFPPIVLASVN